VNTQGAQLFLDRVLSRKQNKHLSKLGNDQKLLWTFAPAGYRVFGTIRKYLDLKMSTRSFPNPNV